MEEYFKKHVKYIEKGFIYLTLYELECAKKPINLENIKEELEYYDDDDNMFNVISESIEDDAILEVLKEIGK